MKIDVIVPSRGHPLRLMSVLTCFDALATGNNEVAYRIVCDEDDQLTAKAIGKLPGITTIIHSGVGPLSPRMNSAALESDAELITNAGDDTFPLAQYWDDIIASGLDQGHDMFSWQEVNDPTNNTMLVFSKRWLKAVGRMLPEYFPFWFGDTWVAEVYELALQHAMPIVTNLQWGGKRGKTKGMFDLAFWFEFFAATRCERIAEARAVCFALDKPFTENLEMLADMARRDAEQLKKVPQYEEWFGANLGEPSEQYAEMKTLADNWLRKKQ